MKRTCQPTFDTQVHDYLQYDISLCFDSAQHDTLNVRERTLSGVEGYTSQNGFEVNINSKI